MRHLPNYQSVFSDHSAGQTLSGPPLPPVPTIRQFQEIIEKAWAQGYDETGAKHFSRKLVNSRKWIGTTEVFTVFTFLGIKVKMFDFPRATGPKRTHTALIRWVKHYFETDALDPDEAEGSGKKRQRDAFEKIMVTGGQTVKQTEKQPLFLQHQGHSKVIVGIELGTNGKEASLLVFDPSRQVNVVLAWMAMLTNRTDRTGAKSREQQQTMPHKATKQIDQLSNANAQIKLPLALPPLPHRRQGVTPVDFPLQLGFATWHTLLAKMIWT